MKGAMRYCEEPNGFKGKPENSRLRIISSATQAGAALSAQSVRPAHVEDKLSDESPSVNREKKPQLLDPRPSTLDPCADSGLRTFDSGLRPWRTNQTQAAGYRAA